MIVREEMMIPMDCIPNGKGSSRYQREDGKWVSGFDRKFIPDGVRIVDSPIFGIDKDGNIVEDNNSVFRVMNCHDRVVPGEFVIDENTMDDEARGVFVNMVMETARDLGIQYVRMVRICRMEFVVDGELHPRLAVAVNGCIRHGELK